MITAALRLVGDTGTVCLGEIRAEETLCASPAEVVSLLRSFCGQGWLCCADRPELLLVSGPAEIPADDTWIECGELSQGKQSLHVARVKEGWSVLNLREIENTASVLETCTLMGRGGIGALAYRVCYSVCDVGGIEELRPTAFRFIGFAVPEEDEHE